MRVSVDSEEFKNGQRAKIFLDGAEVTDVISADDIEGHVVVAKRGRDGLIEWNRDSGDVTHQDLYGAVRIETFYG